MVIWIWVRMRDGPVCEEEATCECPLPIPLLLHRRLYILLITLGCCSAEEDGVSESYCDGHASELIPTFSMWRPLVAVAEFLERAHAGAAWAKMLERLREMRREWRLASLVTAEGPGPLTGEITLPARSRTRS